MQIGLAEDHRAGGSQPAHQRGIRRRYPVPKEPRTRRGPKPAGGKQVLDRNRHPEQRTRLTPGQPLLRSPGFPPSLLARRRDEGTQVRRLLDPFVVRVHQLERRDGPAPQRRRGLGQRRGSCHQSFQGSGASAALNSSTSARYRFHAGASASRSAAVSRSPAARVAAASWSLSVIGTVCNPEPPRVFPSLREKVRLASSHHHLRVRNSLTRAMAPP